MTVVGKIFLIAGLTLAAIGLGFLLDAKIFDRGEENRAPNVGIKAAAVEPKFATVDSRPVVSVFVKGEATRVWLDVAPRINPTSGGETLATYDLEAFESFPADRLSPAETGTVRRWATVMPVPEKEGQYLLTAYAADDAGRETKFKIFNSILVVQPTREQLAGDTPGQSTILKFADFLKVGQPDQAAELLMPELRAQISPAAIFDSGDEITIKQFELLELSVSAGQEKDRMLLATETGEEREYVVDLEVNRLEPLSKWQILKAERIK